MKIIGWFEFLEEALPLDGNHSAITVGVFDGVHRGHRALIERVVAQAAVPVVVTFGQGHHKKVLGSGQDYPGSILSFRQKMAAFERLGISITIVIDFSESFRRMTGADFLEMLQLQGKMSYLAVGSNFRCGYQLDTDADAIRSLNAQRDIPTDIVPVLTEGGIQISSSQIRAAIARRDLQTAASMLGCPFTVDLSGSFSGGVYAIAEQGCILPPPGRYAVHLIGEKAGQPVKAEILVDSGAIIIGKDLPDRDVRFEYAEFLPCS